MRVIAHRTIVEFGKQHANAKHLLIVGIKQQYQRNGRIFKI